MYYVKMRDKFLEILATNVHGKKEIVVIECETLEEARIVEENAKNRTDMTYINVTSKKPYYSKDTHRTVYKDKNSDFKAFFVKGYFKK